MSVSPPVVAAAATARATANVFEKAPAPASALPVARTEHLGNRLAAGSPGEGRRRWPLAPSNRAWTTWLAGAPENKQKKEAEAQEEDEKEEEVEEEKEEEKEE